MAGFSRRKMRRVSDNNRKELYEFMTVAAKEISDDPQIWRMFFSHGGYHIRFVLDKETSQKCGKNVYMLYMCDEDDRAYSKKPFFVGDLDETVEYLNDERNVDFIKELIE